MRNLHEELGRAGRRHLKGPGRIQDAADRLAKPGEVWRVDYHRQSLEIYLETEIKHPAGSFLAREPVWIESDLNSVMDRARQQIEDLVEQRKEIAAYMRSMHTKCCR